MIEAVGTVTNNRKTATLFHGGAGSRTVTIGEMAKEFLQEAQVKYGQSINTYDVLANFGITETKGLLKNGRRYMQYLNLARRLGDELVEHLTLYGFKADKKKKPAYEGFDNTLHVNGNMVYTNYPWTVVQKSVAAVNESINAMTGEHDKGIDLEPWREISEVEVDAWKDLAAAKKKFGDVDMQLWKENVFDPMSAPLIDRINENWDEMVMAVRDKQPKNYGVYNE